MEANRKIIRMLADKDFAGAQGFRKDVFDRTAVGIFPLIKLLGELISEDKSFRIEIERDAEAADITIAVKLTDGSASSQVEL